jgi:hypothetical protein
MAEAGMVREEATATNNGFTEVIPRKKKKFVVRVVKSAPRSKKSEESVGNTNGSKPKLSTTANPGRNKRLKPPMAVMKARLVIVLDSPTTFLEPTLKIA